MAAVQKLEEQAVKSGKETEAQSKKMLDFFSNLKREAIGLVAAFYGGKGLKEVISHITNLDSSTERLSRTFGVSTHDLALWQIAMQQVGGSVEDARSAIGGLQAAVQQFLLTGSPDPGMLSVFNRIGVAPGDQTNPLKILEALSRFSQTPGMREHPERFAAVANLLPGMNQGMINLLSEGPKKLKEFLDAAEKTGAATKETGLASERFIKSLALLEAASEGLARVFLEKLIPAMDSLANLFPKFLVSPGTPEARAVEKDFNKHLEQHFGTSRWLWEMLFGPKTAAEMFGPAAAKTVPRGDTGIGGVFGGATGYQIIEGGVVTGSGVFPPTGAKGAAAVSNVSSSSNRSSTRTSTSETKIGDVYVNAPNATDSRGIASSIKGHLSDSLGAPVNSAY